MSEDPQENPAWTNAANQPNAQRSVKRIFIVVAVVIGLGFVVVNWVFSTPQQTANNQETVVSPSSNSYEPGTARSGVYNFFYQVFGGIEDGIEDSPHNLNNVEHIDNNDLDTFEQARGPKIQSPNAIAENIAENTVNVDDGYRYSVADIIGGEVKGSKGNHTGTVHDIIINKETGEAKTIIMKEDGKSYYDRDLAALNFKNIISQDANGDTQMTITENQIENKKDFDYNVIVNSEKYLSLKSLRKGQLLDFENNVAGEVDAVIYNNAEVQKIYFALRAALSPTGKPITFGLPYDAVQVVLNPDGYDVKLTKEQTFSLAESLFGN